MSHSVKSKTIRHDCHLLVRAVHNHLKTLVFLLPLFKPNRHKLESIKGDELFFLRSAKIRCSKRAAHFLRTAKGILQDPTTSTAVGKHQRSQRKWGCVQHGQPRRASPHMLPLCAGDRAATQHGRMAREKEGEGFSPIFPNFSCF